VQALALLLQNEHELPARSAALRAKVAGTSKAAEIDDGIAAILVARFSGRSIQEHCAMGGITLDDFTQSVAYREIFGRGRQEGWQEGELDLALRLLQKRCGQLAPEQERRFRELPPQQLEALAEAVLDFEGMADLNVWLTANG
jgi:predicted transposase YdaD